jgi:hypothetical protein
MDGIFPKQESYAFLEQHPDIKTLAIEGVDFIAEDKKEVCALLDSLVLVATKHQIPIIGTIGAPKMKQNDRYVLKRSSIYGTMAWGRKIETIVLLSRQDESDENGPRQCDVLVRNGRSEKFTFAWDNNRLVEPVAGIPAPLQPKKPLSAFERFLKTKRLGEQLKHTPGCGISRTEFYDGRKEYIGKGVCLDKGEYYRAFCEALGDVPFDQSGFGRDMPQVVSAIQDAQDPSVTIPQSDATGRHVIGEDRLHGDMLPNSRPYVPQGANEQ